MLFHVPDKVIISEIYLLLFVAIP